MNPEIQNLSVSFTYEFCVRLEYAIGVFFENNKKENTRGFWCDGVLHSPLNEKQLEKKWVNDKRKIETVAWIGKGGEVKYEMTIHFGKYSLRRYAKGADMTDCIPDENNKEWVDIDVENKLIEIWLK